MRATACISMGTHIKSNSSRRRGGPIFEHINGLGTNTNLVVSPDGTQNQEELCRQGPAAIYCYAIITVCWNVTPCSLVDRYIRFG
jgi:hypothetical protein